MTRVGHDAYGQRPLEDFGVLYVQDAIIVPKLAFRHLPHNVSGSKMAHAVLLSEVSHLCNA